MNNILSLLSFPSSAIFLFFGAHVLSLNAKGRENRFFFLLCLCFAIWSFSYAFVFIATSEDSRRLWYKLGALYEFGGDKEFLQEVTDGFVQNVQRQLVINR